MDGTLKRDSFENLGFSVLKQSEHFLKLQKGHCEIHIKRDDDRIVLEIPVIELFGNRKTSLPLMEYLLERNGQLKGPGFFGIRDNCVFYISVLFPQQAVEKVALQMQETVETLAPKIINVCNM
ncbi:MAG TPA: hypothetical protein PLB36_01185 [Bacillota bacterium]|jgi:hypothetical protein|nr:hypothetical protein [Candidatus Fermentithermobacillaceae bacterium]HOB29962.1 hypothetical protein [Bacillota bacterium]HOK63833.1 hypothetical protein [Bacillota bacterium]HOL11479.1 hypothetical protein [Bacillota bacterium]HOQ03209.1 hypothetical protein [Bacillota bacterium]